MDAKNHWEKIYSTKAPDAVSWFRAHLETSLALIERAAGAHSASIVDVGGGESTLVDDLLARGYQDITVLDISETAIDATKKRLGTAAEHVSWLVGDITEVQLAPNAYDVWHDRAVFHFLITPEQRAAYVRQVAAAVRPGGPHKVQRPRCRALRRRIAAQTIRRPLPSGGEFDGTAPNSIWHHATVSLLLLPCRLIAVREFQASARTSC